MCVCIQAKPAPPAQVLVLDALTMKWTRPVVEGATVCLRTRHSAVAVHSDYEEHSRGDICLLVRRLTLVILYCGAFVFVFVSLSCILSSCRKIFCVSSEIVFFFFVSCMLCSARSSPRVPPSSFAHCA